MTFDYEYRFHSSGPEHTRAMGTAMGRLLLHGRLVLLNGDLGSGKTCFVQGLARGLDVPEVYDITSPTYTLINEYPGRLPLLHVDLYRLATIDDAESIGLWELLTRPAVVAVEWADRLGEEHWPGEALHIAFEGLTGDTRRLRLFGHGLEGDNLIDTLAAKWSHIVQRLK